MSLSIPVYFWLRPLWKDVKKIEIAAHAIGAGKTDTQIGTIEHTAVRPIGQALDQMAAQVDMLIKQQDRLIQDIAHEIRTPLARLRYRLALLPEAEYESAFNRDIDSIEQLVEELLFQAQLDAQGNAHQITSTFNASQWLNNCIQEAQIGSDASIQWQRHIDNQINECRGDFHLLNRALSNLLVNAKKFTHEHIDVQLTQTADAYFLSVSDDGPGIPQEQSQDIFQAFYRLDQSRNRKTGGFGLGLSIVASIAQAHQGHIEVRPSSYSGACFVMSWPKNPTAIQNSTKTTL